MPPRKRAAAKTAPAPSNQPADANLPITSPAPTTQPAVQASGDVARYAGDQTGQPTATEAPKRAGPAPSVAVGDVVRLTPDEATPDAPAQYVQVITKVAGTEHRDDGALVVPLPEPRWMPLSAFATD